MSNDKMAMNDSRTFDDNYAEEELQSLEVDDDEWFNFLDETDPLVLADVIWKNMRGPLPNDYSPSNTEIQEESTLSDQDSIIPFMSPIQIEALQASWRQGKIYRDSIVEKKRQIESERNSLLSEKEKPQDEKTNLWEERTSHDCQSKLYEAEEGTLQKEIKNLQKICEDLCREIVKLKHELQESKIAIKELQAENNKLKENEELKTLHQIKSEVREKEFEDMRTMPKTLKHQLQTLAFENLQLRSENDTLGGQESQASNSGESADRQFVNVLMEE